MRCGWACSVLAGLIRTRAVRTGTLMTRLIRAWPVKAWPIGTGLVGTRLVGTGLVRTWAVVTWLFAIALPLWTRTTRFRVWPRGTISAFRTRAIEAGLITTRAVVWR